jgi:hypothetical protein
METLPHASPVNDWLDYKAFVAASGSTLGVMKVR